MAEEPRRSGRATKGQHKNASSSPAPQPKPAKQQLKSKQSQQQQQKDDSTAEYDDEEEKIRCICGDDNPKDKRAFIGCEACEVWQHNICMGMPVEEDEVPDHYFCEECRPEEHAETLAAMAKGERIWETRNRIYANEKKAGSKSKGKGGKGGGGWLKKDVVGDGDEMGEGDGEGVEETEMVVGSKRKRGEEVEAGLPSRQRDVKLEEEAAAAEEEGKNTRSSRQDKRRKPTVDDSTTAREATTDTRLLPIDELPKDRRPVATALSNILLEDLTARSQSGTLPLPTPESTPESLANTHASRIEHALFLTYTSTANPQYSAQFRTLNANLKKNKVLITRLLDGSLTADELSTMNSKDMASEELQKERAVMKEQLDRQAVAVQVEEGRPRFRRTHKGDEEIEDENARIFADGATGGGQRAQPVRERSYAQDGGAGSPVEGGGSPEPLRVDTVRSQSMGQNPSGATGLGQRRTSSQQFDMNNIWAKTAQSPTSSTTPGGGVGGTTTATRPLQMPPRRTSTKPQPPPSQDGAGGGGGGTGTKEDADIDRMLQDDNFSSYNTNDEDDETYSPADYASPDSIVWQGKLLQTADAVSPTVSARFVAGRDLTSTLPWRHLLPQALGIDGRLQVAKAEEYLCSLQWSQSSDVSVLALTPSSNEGNNGNDEDKEGFDTVFRYFKSRERYAVVNRGKHAMVKDLYIIPLDQGEEVPMHVGMLEFNRLGAVAGEKCLLASLVVARGAAGTPVAGQQGMVDGAGDVLQLQQQQQEITAAGVNGGQQQQQYSLPQHMRAGVGVGAGPAGSPLNHAGRGTFSPPSSSSNTTHPIPTGAPPPLGAGDHHHHHNFNPSASLPPNPYGAPHQQQQQQQQQQQPGAGNASFNNHPNPLVNEILGPLQHAPTAKDVIDADPTIEREKLVHLKQILEEDPRTRTDIGALYGYLTR